MEKQRNRQILGKITYIAQKPKSHSSIGNKKYSMPNVELSKIYNKMPSKISYQNSLIHRTRQQIRSNDNSFIEKIEDKKLITAKLKKIYLSKLNRTRKALSSIISHNSPSKICKPSLHSINRGYNTTNDTIKISQKIHQNSILLPITSDVFKKILFKYKQQAYCKKPLVFNNSFL